MSCRPHKFIVAAVAYKGAHELEVGALEPVGTAPVPDLDRLVGRVQADGGKLVDDKNLANFLPSRQNGHLLSGVILSEYSSLPILRACW